MKKHPFWSLTAILFSLALLASACGDGDTEAAAGGDDESSVEDGAMEDDAMEDGDAMEDDAMEGMEDGEHGDDHGGHDHGESIDVPEGMAVPQISVSAEPDSVKGHNLFIDLADFEISPENASTDPVDGQGHLHLYVNGERQMRFYNTALHLTDLPEGEHEIMVEVSANNHSAYAVDGEPITAMTSITVEAMEDGEGHGGHGGDADLVEVDPAPGLDIEVTKDPKSGWNVRAIATDFTFAPEAAGAAAVDGEGHVHLYVDGERLTRLYGEWWHISKLSAGNHDIMVEAASNDHKVYGADGEPVMAMTSIEVSEEEASAEGHGGHGDDEHGDDKHGDDEHGDDDAHGHSGSGEAMDMAAADADVVVDIVISGDDVDVADRRIEVSEGQTVGVTVTSDTEEQIHIHGYDLLADIGPGEKADVAFLADSPGVFEVELEESGRFLFEIEVS